VDEALGAAVVQLLHQLQTNVFLCILDVANVKKWLSVTASLKCFITVIKCGFSELALHSSQASAIVALSDCNLSNAFATGCSYLFVYPF